MSFEMTQQRDHIRALCQLMSQSHLHATQAQICTMALSLYEAASAHLFCLDATAQHLELVAGQVAGDTLWAPEKIRLPIMGPGHERCALQNVALSQAPLSFERQNTAWDLSVLAPLLRGHRLVSHISVIPLKRGNGNLMAILVVGHDGLAHSLKSVRQKELIIAAMGALLDREMQLDQMRVREKAYSKSLDRALSDRGKLSRSATVFIEQRFAGSSKAARALRRALAQTAFEDHLVLLTGGAQAGMQEVARLIHELGSLSNGPFLSVDAALLSDDVIAPELLGHKRGAIQGVAAARKGLLSAAAQGSLIIFNLEELSAKGQRVLLDILQERQFRPIGSSRPEALRSAVILAIDPQKSKSSFLRMLTSLAAPRKFAVPSLLDHRGDVAALLAAALAQHNKNHSATVTLDPALSAKLIQMADMPDRAELSTLVEAALGRLGRQGSLTWEALFDEGQAREDTPPGEYIQTLGDAVEQFERTLIRDCLSAHDFNRALVAQKLGLPKRTLADKCKKYGL